MLTADYIADRWPVLFHTAEAEAWESIQQRGLLSTSRLLDLFEITGHEREALEARKRPESVRLDHPVHGSVVIRDNKPIIETVLRRTLVEMSEADWYRSLNRRVFFWLTRRRLDVLHSAAFYRNRPQAILTIDTAKLLNRHGERVELSSINSGAVSRFSRTPRGPATFSSISAYPFTERRRVNATEPVVELTVLDGVPDISDLVIDVATTRPD